MQLKFVMDHQKKCLYTHEFEKEQGDKIGKQLVCGAWSPNGKCLVFGTEDSCVCVFTFGDKEPRLQFQQIYNIPKKIKMLQLKLYNIYVLMKMEHY